MTLLTTAETFFNHRALWVRYTQTVTQLYSISDKLDYLSAGQNADTEDKDLDKLFDELQRTFAQTNDFWKSERSEQAKPKAAKGN
ncbi:hypothetical protein HDF11_005224 [Tunturiibacter psychrotolerans]